MYTLFIWSALFVWLAVVPAALRLLRLPLPKGLWPAYCAVPFALFGARLLNVVLYGSPAERLLDASFGSFTLYGGIILGAGAAFLLMKALRLPVWRYFDALAPVCGLSIAVARVGCILTGCCFGVPTGLPWAVTPPYGSAAHSFQLETGQIGKTVFGLPEPPLPVHPTQAYELAAALLAAAVAVVLIKKRATNGVPAAAFGLTLSTLRLVIFFFRAFPGETALSLLFRGPVLFGVSIVFLAGILVWLIKYDKRGPRTGGPAASCENRKAPRSSQEVEREETWDSMTPAAGAAGRPGTGRSTSSSTTRRTKKAAAGTQAARYG